MQAASSWARPFAEACRARLPGVEVVVAVAESLPFSDGAFDATLSQLVVNFMRDAETGVLHMARVTRPGGVVASCVWTMEADPTGVLSKSRSTGSAGPLEALITAERFAQRPGCERSSGAGEDGGGPPYGPLLLLAVYRVSSASSESPSSTTTR